MKLKNHGQLSIQNKVVNINNQDIVDPLSLSSKNYLPQLKIIFFY